VFTLETCNTLRVVNSHSMSTPCKKVTLSMLQESLETSTTWAIQRLWFETKLHTF